MTKALRWLALAALFILALEVSARAEDWVRYRMPILSPFRDQSDLMLRDRDGAHARPNSRYMKWVINGLGMRGPPASATKPMWSLRVITVGASETFGLYESPNHEYPRQLEDSLRTAIRSGSVCRDAALNGIEVLNAGFPGMSLPTVEQDIRLRLGRLRPDIVIVYPTPTQYLSEDPPSAASPGGSGRSIAPPISRALHLRVLDRLREQAKQLVPESIQTWIRRREITTSAGQHAAGWSFDAPPTDRLALFDRELRTVIGAVRRAGAEPILVSHANAFNGALRHDQKRMAMWQKFYPRASGETLIKFDSIARPMVARMATDSQVPYLDLQPLLNGPGWFQDISHFTDQGAARFAHGLLPLVARVAGSTLKCLPR